MGSLTLNLPIFCRLRQSYFHFFSRKINELECRNITIRPIQILECDGLPPSLLGKREQASYGALLGLSFSHRKSAWLKRNASL